MKGKSKAMPAKPAPKMAPPFAAKKKASNGMGKGAAMKRFAAGKMEC